MTVAPWRLPIRELRWGRFLTASDALVWIRWRGARPLLLLDHNGRRLSAGEVGDGGVRAAGCSLGFGATRVLRDGPLGATVLRGVPGLRRRLPAAILGARETKWCSRGELAAPGSPPRAGWAIHEVVRFAELGA
jgi:hypothetical protein